MPTEPYRWPARLEELRARAEDLAATIADGYGPDAIHYLEEADTLLRDGYTEEARLILKDARDEIRQAIADAVRIVNAMQQAARGRG